LFETRNGFHIKLFFDRRLSVDENFCIRERYNDCSVRLSYSRQRYSVTGQGYDILFNMKKGFWRKMIG